MSTLINGTEKSYVFMPVDMFSKSLFFAVFVVYFLVGTAGNAILLFAVRQVQVNQRGKPKRAMDRNLTTTFLYSLTLNNVLTAVSALVINGFQMYVDMFTSDWSCRALRFTTYTLSIIKIFNMVVISVEKYFSIFYPMKLSSSPLVKKLLAATWVGGVILGVSLTSIVKRVHEDLGPSTYTVTCQYDKDAKAVFFGTTTVVYFVPCILLLVLAIRITRFLNKRRRKVMNETHVFVDRAYMWRFKDGRMFVNIILTVALPYSLFAIFAVLRVILKFEHDFYHSWIVRNVNAVFALSNCVFIPVFSFANNRQFRVVLMRLTFKRRNNQNVGQGGTETRQGVKRVGGQRERPRRGGTQPLPERIICLSASHRQPITAPQQDNQNGFDTAL